MNISIKLIVLGYFISFGIKSTHCHIGHAGWEAALSGCVTETTLPQQSLLAFCATVTLRPGTSRPPPGLNIFSSSALTSNWVCSSPFLSPPGPCLSSPIPFHLPLFLSATHVLLVFFPLGFCLAKHIETNTKNLDHNTGCQHATQPISLFSLFSFCFPIHNKDHKGCKSEIISWSRFFQQSAQWGPILPYTMMISCRIKFFKEGGTIGTW